MSSLTKSTLSASAAPFSPPPSVSASAPVFVPQRAQPKLNPRAAAFAFDISKLGGVSPTATTTSPADPAVVLHIESPSLSQSKESEQEQKETKEQKETQEQKEPKEEKEEKEPKKEISIPTTLSSAVVPTRTASNSTARTASNPVAKPTKYVYTRQELLDFRNRPECAEPPTGVDLSGITSVDDAGKGKQPVWRGAKKPVINNNNNNNIASVRGGKRDGGSRIRRDAPLDIDVAPLQVTENRYVVKKDVEGEEKALRILNGILNKLTPESFDNLLQQVLKMGINTVSLLTQAVDAIFEKALSEPTFSPVYAEFCEKLSTSLPPVLDEEGKTKKFKSLLLNQCQQEFENQDRTKEGQELDEAAKKQRQLGTIRFIGELFVRGLLKPNIMFDCIRMLSDKASEENIEALCKLLRTVGKTLDKSDTPRVNDVFVTLKEMTAHEGLNFRFRFMLQDVIDLRREKWVGRIETLKAKKLSDVHKQDEEDKKRKERQERALAKQAEDARRAAAPTNRKAAGDRYTNLRSPQKPAPAVLATPADDGFVTQGVKKGKRTTKPDPRQAIKPSARVDTRVSKSKTKKNETEEVKKPSQPSGFGVLELENDNSDDGEMNDAEEEVEEVEDQGEESEKSRDEALNSIERLLYDYLRSQDMKEATECIQELGTTQFHSDIVEKGVAMLFEQKKEGADLLTALFRQLAVDDVLLRKHFEKGLLSTIEMLDDLIIDFPLALSQLAAFVSPLIVDSVLPLSIFSSEAASNLKASGSLGKWFDLTLKNIEGLGKSDDFVKKLVQNSKLNLASLFKSPNLLETFLSDHQELKALAA